MNICSRGWSGGQGAGGEERAKFNLKVMDCALMKEMMIP